MVNQTTFGRRITPQRQPLRVAEKRDPVPPSAHIFGQESVGHPLLVQGQLASVRIDHELEEWKQARKSRSKIPWTRLYLMASLCFGTASLVLPESVNDNLDWLLYGLMTASLYAGLSRWWRRL